MAGIYPFNPIAREPAAINDVKAPQREDIQVSLSRLEPYEAGALVFSYLAFPEPGAAAEEQRAEVHAALCHLALKAAVTAQVVDSWTPQSAKLGYLLRSESQQKTALRTYENRYLDRLRAATIAKPFLEERPAGVPPRLPPGVQKLTLEAMAEWREQVDKPGKTPDPKNFLSRVWRPSRAVLPLALAVNTLNTRLRMAGGDLLSVPDILRHRDATEFLVETAQSLEDKVLGVKAFAIRPEELLRFRLA